MDEFKNNENDKIIDDTIIDEEKPKKKKSFRGSAISYIALALVASLIGGLGSTYLAPKLYGNILPYPNNKVYASGQSISITPSDNLSTVSAVAKKAMGSVVGITTVETRQFFLGGQQDVSGSGSGVIVDSNGYILTNSHVVANGNAKDIKVLFENGDEIPGTVLWNDPILDLAIVKVELTNLPAATLGDSDSLEVGEIAIAIGNPLGLEFQRSVTSGIISGLHRSVQVQSTIIEDLIQTDASINPGNSGGPLLNGKGEVVGINTAKVTSGEGLGFSIPINQAKLIIDEVINNGAYKAVFMGISGVSVNEYESRLGVKLSTDKGIVLVQVAENSPADKGGLVNGDIIKMIDNVEVENMTQLKKSLYKYKQGDKATLTIVRNNREMKLDITFTDLK